MKQAQKTIIIVAVLLAPILVFLFLKQFGQNRFELPVYYPAGNPVVACNDTLQPHRLTSVLVVNNIVKLPALFYIPGDSNRYDADLANVLDKYQQISVYAVYEGEAQNNGSRAVPLSFMPDSFPEFINCQLALGEDHWLNEPIPDKYVMVDRAARIRGYFDCTRLEEIERLDTELDILLNYSAADETQ